MLLSATLLQRVNCCIGLRVVDVVNRLIRKAILVVVPSLFACFHRVGLLTLTVFIRAFIRTATSKRTMTFGRYVAQLEKKFLCF